MIRRKPADRRYQARREFYNVASGLSRPHASVLFPRGPEDTKGYPARRVRSGNRGISRDS